MENNLLLKRLRGYQKADRNRFLLLANGTLTQEEFLVYELAVAITDWDPKHTDTYGTFAGTNIQIASLLGWKSDSSVCRLKKRLIKKNIFIEVNERLRVFDFEKWQLRKNPAEKQPEVAEIEPPTAKTQTPVANLQPIRVQRPDYSLGSFKGEYKFSVNKEEYLSLKAKVEELYRLIGNKWFDTDPQIQRFVNQHQYLAGKMLEYEIEHDLIPI